MAITGSRGMSQVWYCVFQKRTFRPVTFELDYSVYILDMHKEEACTSHNDAQIIVHDENNREIASNNASRMCAQVPLCIRNATVLDRDGVAHQLSSFYESSDHDRTVIVFLRVGAF
jgi:hypothetical protein